MPVAALPRELPSQRHRASRRAVWRRGLAAAGLAAALAVPVAVPATASPGAPASAGTAASPTLRPGAHGPAVATLQRLLGLPADGKYGPRTKRVVGAFQRAHRLKADGVVGPRTWRALRWAAGTTPVSRSATRASFGPRVVTEAARHEGEPYVYGAKGPASFDCSGFVQYVFSQVGVTLPRTSAAQAAAARPVAQADRQLGDLVIFRNRGGRVYHVGIYAGDDTMWVARHTGTTITRQKLWTTAYGVGRFGA
jgi:peptidoglycan DL-endopeptidase CwlO